MTNAKEFPYELSDILELELPTVTIGLAFGIAAGVRCVDGVYDLGCTESLAVACMHKLGEDLYDLMGCENHADTVEYFARQGAYHRLRDAIEDLYPDVSGVISDPWTAETFSDLYKDDYGCRPRGHETGRAMREWMKSRHAN